MYQNDQQIKDHGHNNRPLLNADLGLHSYDDDDDDDDDLRHPDHQRLIRSTWPQTSMMTPEDRGLSPLRIRPLSGLKNEKRRRIRKIWFLIGSFMGVALSPFIVLSLYLRFPASCQEGRCASACRSWLPFQSACLRNKTDGNEILKYLNLWAGSFSSNTTTNTTIPKREARHLLGTGSDTSHDPQLVIAGKMTVDDGSCNIGQYNLKKKEWSLTERIQLSLYNSYSGGEVYSLLANHTFLSSGDSESEDDDSSRRYVSMGLEKKYSYILYTYTIYLISLPTSRDLHLTICILFLITEQAVPPRANSRDQVN